MEPTSTNKCLNDDEDGPLSKKQKKQKPPSEVAAIYSDAVRKKLASTSRTGQACDRCRERKMKCDTNPVACLPCRQKALRCFTTDRVTGNSRERGQTDRAENELYFLRDKLAAYQSRYGTLQRDDFRSVPFAPSTEIPGPPTPTPSSHYVGWPPPHNIEPVFTGPVNGTQVDILDGIVDIADFECEMLQDPPPHQRNVFNLSRISITNTIFGFQKIGDPKLPPKEEALKEANHFLVIMHQYVPIVHKPSFMDLVNRSYDHGHTVSAAERIQVLVVLAIMAHQSGVRNHDSSAQKFEESYRYLHYALGFYRELYQDCSLASMQAMALIVVHFRNLPKPGVSWTYCHKVLIRAINLQYHRDPDKIKLPPEENNPLSKELRKRVFHSILGVCITTGCRVGRPAPQQFQHVDVPLPVQLKDADLSTNGFSANPSDGCDWWPCIHLAKLLPLLTELYNNVISVRRPPQEYVRTVDALNTKIMAWRQDWDDSIKDEHKHINLAVASLLIETWAAEFQLTLHHPACCTSSSPDVIERNLDMCHKSAKRLLQAFHILSREYKGVDFTWHSTAAYAMGFGITLYVLRRRRAQVTRDQYESIRNELSGWMSLVAYADLVLKTGNHLQRIFKPRSQAVEEDYRGLITENSSSHIPPPHNSFQPVNGAVPKPQLKTEPSPQQAQSSMPPHHDSKHQISSPPTSAPPQYNAAPTQPPSSAPIPWSASPNMQYVPHPNANVSEPPPQGYPFYTLPAPTPSQYQPIPTSLAPLLNDPNGIYVSYPTPPQTQTAGQAHDSLMSYSPAHYYDGQGAMMWPLITMPPGSGQ